MRFLVQRVTRASVAVEGKIVGEIGKGFLVLAGISKSDIHFDENKVSEEAFSREQKEPLERHSLEIAEKMTKKLLGLRIFEDENGKTNLDLKAVGGSLLIISQFTLYADCRKGNRPSFTNAGEPEKAELLYQYIVDLCRREVEGAYSMDMEKVCSMEEVHSMEEIIPSVENSPEGMDSLKEEDTISLKMGYSHSKVETGIFGADMKVESVNDGPFTVLLDSDEILR